MLTGMALARAKTSAQSAHPLNTVRGRKILKTIPIPAAVVKLIIFENTQFRVVITI